MLHLSIRDHPRIRGEHARHERLRQRPVGIIPAYAGSTRSRSSGIPYPKGSSPHTRGARRIGIRNASCSWDHPRIRGEHLLLRDHLPVQAGIIPAYAGSTYSPVRLRYISSGSSPHTRGAPRTRRPSSPCQWDHPRIRGEHHHCHAQKAGEPGIIPAYAGSTRTRQSSQAGTPGSSPHTRGARRRIHVLSVVAVDHPRIRGEHIVTCAAIDNTNGIIPAYAGSTARANVLHWRAVGSSPHTRGAPVPVSKRHGI